MTTAVNVAQAIREMEKIIMRNPKVGQFTGLFDTDHINEWLQRAASTPWGDLQQNASGAHYRTAIRALAAIMPGKSLDDAANRIQALLNTSDKPELSVSDVKHILRGTAGEIPFEKIQTIGRLLSEGRSYRNISEQLGVARETVTQIDKFLGVTVARKDKLINSALAWIEEGQDGIRPFARREALTYHEARQIMERAKEIQKELAC